MQTGQNGPITLTQIAKALEQVIQGLGTLTIKGADAEVLANLRNAIRNIAATLVHKDNEQTSSNGVPETVSVSDDVPAEL